MSPRRQGKRVRAKFAALQGKGKTARRKPKADFHAILGRLRDAISIVATATRSMVSIEQSEGSIAEPQVDIGEELITLEHGVRALRAAYDEMDVALRAVTP